MFARKGVTYIFARKEGRGVTFEMMLFASSGREVTLPAPAV